MAVMRHVSDVLMARCEDTQREHVPNGRPRLRVVGQGAPGVRVVVCSRPAESPWATCMGPHA